MLRTLRHINRRFLLSVFFAGTLGTTQSRASSFTDSIKRHGSTGGAVTVAGLATILSGLWALKAHHDQKRHANLLATTAAELEMNEGARKGVGLLSQPHGAYSAPHNGAPLVIKQESPSLNSLDRVAELKRELRSALRERKWAIASFLLSALATIGTGYLWYNKDAADESKKSNTSGGNSSATPPAPPAQPAPSTAVTTMATVGTQTEGTTTSSDATQLLDKDHQVPTMTNRPGRKPSLLNIQTNTGTPATEPTPSAPPVNPVATQPPAPSAQLSDEDVTILSHQSINNANTNSGAGSSTHSKVASTDSAGNKAQEAPSSQNQDPDADSSSIGAGVGTGAGSSIADTSATADPNSGSSPSSDSSMTTQTNSTAELLDNQTPMDTVLLDAPSPHIGAGAGSSSSTSSNIADNIKVLENKIKHLKFSIQRAKKNNTGAGTVNQRSVELAGAQKELKELKKLAQKADRRKTNNNTPTKVDPLIDNGSVVTIPTNHNSTDVIKFTTSNNNSKEVKSIKKRLRRHYKERTLLDLSELNALHKRWNELDPDHNIPSTIQNGGSSSKK